MFDDNVIAELKKGAETSFVDKKIESQTAFQPRLLTNNHEQGKKVLPYIEKELASCEDFYISVAFITKGGITPLLQVFRELSARNIKGKILTTDYLHFSEPDAIRKLNEFSNIEVRMYQTNDSEDGFHTKGYIFREKGIYKIIIGSSNLTLSALTVNREWNSRFVSTQNGQYADEVLEEFDELWKSNKTKTIDEYLPIYESQYKVFKAIREESDQKRREGIKASYEIYHIKPNSMQKTFLENLKEIRDKGEDRALLISATGTGKTYASAFAIREFNPTKVLFLVHREQIAKQSIESYKRIFGDGVTYGLLSGTSKQRDANFLFSTRDSMSKDENLHSFAADEFDVICVDEVHRAGASTYQKIMDYFHPKFWLGMTATPERTDDFDIFKLFNHNIACEIRLQQALEDNLLCPFHYFGIADISIDGVQISDQLEAKDFNRLVADERVRHIIDNAEYYSYCGDRVKGLIFVSRKEEGKKLSELFNAKGYRTEFLSGEDSQEKRTETIDRLVNDEREDNLDYIFSVDIFNEGIDVPEVNQIIMLRPTQSPIIFVQQLGRGLRKSTGKEYVTILDFIGNYTNNYMIPIALSGDRSYNKDNMRRYVNDGARIIPGSSTIHFDEISRQRIYQSIDQAKTNEKKLLVDAYKNLRYKLGRVPSIMDFDLYESIDPMKFVQRKETGSYYKFVKDVIKDEDYILQLSSEQELLVEYVSRKFMSGKKGQELYVLKMLLDNPNGVIRYKDVLEKMNIERDGQLYEKELQCVVNGLNTKFLYNEDLRKFRDCHFIENQNDEIKLTDYVKKQLDSPAFAIRFGEVVDYGIDRFQKQYSNYYRQTNLCLNRKYTYEETFRALNWESDQNKQNIGGYFYESKTRTFPVYINYDKADDAIAYEDRFLSESKLIALSKKPRQVNSADADHIFLRKEEDKQNKIYLFVRKNKDDKEAKEFYFLGEMKATGEPIPVLVDNKSAFEINYLLDQAVREDIYDYILSGEENENS